MIDEPILDEEKEEIKRLSFNRGMRFASMIILNHALRFGTEPEMQREVIRISELIKEAMIPPPKGVIDDR